MTVETEIPAIVAEPVVVPAAEVAPVVVEPVVAAAVPEAKPERHTDTPTLLEGLGEEKPTPEEVKPEDKPEAEKPVETKPEGEKPAEEVKPEEVPVEAAPVDYSSIKLPEGFTSDAEKMGAFTNILAEHKVSPEVGQQFIDLHTAALQSYADQSLANQHKAFADTRKDWVKQVMADDQLGGAGHQTAMGAVARARDLLVPEVDRPAFDEFLRVTGAGDHPAFLRALHNAARYLDEPAMPPAGIKPPPNIGKAPGKTGLRSIYKNSSTAS